MKGWTLVAYIITKLLNLVIHLVVAKTYCRYLYFTAKNFLTRTSHHFAFFSLLLHFVNVK